MASKITDASKGLAVDELNKLFGFKNDDLLQSTDIDDEGLKGDLASCLECFKADDKITKNTADVFEHYGLTVPENVIVLTEPETGTKPSEEKPKGDTKMATAKKAETKKTAAKAPVPVAKKVEKKVEPAKAVAAKKTPPKVLSLAEQEKLIGKDKKSASKVEPAKSTKSIEDTKKKLVEGAKKKTGARELDKFGYVEGTKSSDAAADLASGKFTMGQIKEKHGTTYYDCLKRMKELKYEIEKKDNGTYKITAPSK